MNTHSDRYIRGQIVAVLNKPTTDHILRDIHDIVLETAHDEVSPVHLIPGRQAMVAIDFHAKVLPDQSQRSVAEGLIADLANCEHVKNSFFVVYEHFGAMEKIYYNPKLTRADYDKDVNAYVFGLLRDNIEVSDE